MRWSLVVTWWSPFASDHQKHNDNSCLKNQGGGHPAGYQVTTFRASKGGVVSWSPPFIVLGDHPLGGWFTHLNRADEFGVNYNIQQG